jgi:hypothetical protein
MQVRTPMPSITATPTNVLWFPPSKEESRSFPFRLTMIWTWSKPVCLQLRHGCTQDVEKL